MNGWRCDMGLVEGIKSLVRWKRKETKETAPDWGGTVKRIRSGLAPAAESLVLSGCVFSFWIFIIVMRYGEFKTRMWMDCTGVRTYRWEGLSTGYW